MQSRVLVVKPDSVAVPFKPAAPVDYPGAEAVRKSLAYDPAGVYDVWRSERHYK